MTGLDIVLAVAGSIVTLLVIAAMILITPRERVDLYAEGTDPQGSNLSGAELPKRSPAPAGS